MIYAQINADNICIGISSLSDQVDEPHMIPIDSYDEDFLWRKFENGAWSLDKFPPAPPTPPLVTLESLQGQIAQMNTDLAAFFDYYFSLNPETPTP